MEGVTDLAVRLWFALTSPGDFSWTPFLRVTDTFPAKIPDDYAPELTILKQALPVPVIPQLMGSRVEDFVRTAELLLPYAPFVDLNCGCPSPTVVGSRAGSSLLEKTDLFARFVSEAVHRLGPGRVSVKMRTGFHAPSEIFGLIKSIQGLPLAQLTVHGRTRPQRYTGLADWSLMREATAQLPFTVVGSGDICDLGSLSDRDSPEISRFIVGRGALRNPWIFEELKTGSKVSAPVVPALVAFGLLQHLGLWDRNQLMTWALEGGALHPAKTDIAAWNRVIIALLKARGDGVTPVGEIEILPRAFARVKMLWNYLRGSLPEAFMEPAILRTKSLPDMLRGIAAIAASEDLTSDLWPLSYNPKWDWMYSGQSRGPQSAASPSNHAQTGQNQ